MSTKQRRRSGKGQPVRQIPPATPQEVNFWRGQLRGSIWVLFEHGTIVTLTGGGKLDDLANRAIALVSGLEDDAMGVQTINSGATPGWIVRFPKACVFISSHIVDSAMNASSLGRERLLTDKNTLNIIEISTA